MDRLDAMALLVEVVDRGSLSAAGRALGVSLPTLSRRISELEAALGTRLLIRTTRRLALTDAGSAYLPAARAILDQVREAERAAAGELTLPKGELVLTAPVVFGRTHVLPIVTEFLERYPQIDVRLRLSDGNAHLIDEQIDIAVRIGPLADSGLIATRLGAMRIVACASPGLLRRHGTPQRPADLASWPWIANDTPANRSGWMFAGADRLDMASRPRLSVGTAEAARDAARDGLGVVRLLHYQVADAVADGSLALLLERHEPPPLPVHLLHVARGTLPLKMRRFLDHAVPRLRRRLTELRGEG